MRPARFFGSMEDFDLTTKAAAEAGGSYTVVARRYRPQTFDELIGQQHIARALKQAISTDRVGHAYLFTGARGVGKTSAARVFAKALDCVKGPATTPCNACDICESIAAGDDVDVLEIDGASNRGIDEIRQLRQNVAVRPSRARFKIYIIDEVHMLTQEAFNALLKTLEEPPPHAILILATTDVHKVPLTIISRCQRFDFKRLNHKEISNHLSLIAKEEGISIDSPALDLISVNSSGSLRDAENLLQQISSIGEEAINEEHLLEFLGLGTFSSSLEILSLILDKEPDKVLTLIQNEVNNGTDPKMIKDRLLKNLRGLIYTKNNLSDLLEETEHTITKFTELSKKYSLANLSLVTSIILNAKVPSNEHPPISLEVAVIDACLYGKPPQEAKQESVEAKKPAKKKDSNQV